MKKSGKKERTTRLDEKMKEAGETKRGEESEGVAEGVLKGAGKIIPGLGSLLEGLEKSPAFKERLKRINQEVERRLKKAPLKRTGDRGPYMESGFSTRTLVQTQGTDLAEEKPSFGRREKNPPHLPLGDPKSLWWMSSMKRII
jgi:hypothetical protein